MNNETPITQLPDGSGCFTATILSNEEALELPLKERPISHRISSEMYHAVFEHIGEASMAWSPNTGSAIFNSEMASDVAIRLCFKIANEVEKATEKLRDEVELKISRLNGMRKQMEKIQSKGLPDLDRLAECVESERYGASMPENIVDAAIEMIKQRGKQLDQWQEQSEKRMADQRRSHPPLHCVSP